MIPITCAESYVSTLYTPTGNLVQKDVYIRGHNDGDIFISAPVTGLKLVSKSPSSDSAYYQLLGSGVLIPAGYQNTVAAGVSPYCNGSLLLVNGTV
jgi:hypothetical protein